jgi:ABC-type phosphate transport system permease subunit
MILLDTAFSVLLFMGTIVGVIALATLIWTILDSGWERLVADPAGFLTNYVSRLPARAGIRAALAGSALASSPASCAWGRACSPAPSPWP